LPRQEAFRQARTERKEPMAEELRIQAIDLTNARRGKQTDQPVTVTGKQCRHYSSRFRPSLRDRTRPRSICPISVPSSHRPAGQSSLDGGRCGLRITQHRKVLPPHALQRKAEPAPTRCRSLWAPGAIRENTLQIAATTSVLLQLPSESRLRVK